MLYRFTLELSDIDRGIYQTMDFRVAQHPSETGPYLITRVLAYALSYQEGLEFAPGGLADTDAPGLQALGKHNAIDLWIEIGNPATRKLHRASKAAERVVVYTYKNPEILVAEMKAGDVHRSSEIQINAFDTKFLEALESLLQKNNRWSVLVQQDRLDIGTGESSVSTEVKKYVCS
ncbi:MAG: YaeQ family protein [Pseudobdellovibrionaceae bacterium]